MFLVVVMMTVGVLVFLMVMLMLIYSKDTLPNENNIIK